MEWWLVILLIVIGIGIGLLIAFLWFAHEMADMWSHM